jgi:hypothetical protein
MYPTVLLLKNGEIFKTFDGELEVENIVEFMTVYLTKLVSQIHRHWKDHFKNDRRSDQDHRLKSDRRADL